jgi:adenosylcobinamide-phosphate guanylyltransferase
MDLSALVMAGGKGERLKSDVEKPLLELCGKHLIDYVLDAVLGCKYIEEYFVLTSPHTPGTKEYLEEKSLNVLEMPGNGYVEDLVFAIKELGLGKTLIVSADLPLLESGDLAWVIEEYQKEGQPALTVVLPRSEKSSIESEVLIDGYVPTGVNIVDGKNLNGRESKLVTTNANFAVNVNTLDDFDSALRRIKNAS